MTAILDLNASALDEASDSQFISKKIIDSNKPEWIKEFKDTKDNTGFCVYSPSGEIPAYDSEDVTKDLDEVISKLSLNGTDITIMIGSGFGHLLKMLMDKKHKDHVVLLIEPINYFLKKTLEIYDFSKQIKDGALILAAQGKQEVTHVMQVLESVRVNESYNILFEKYVNSRIEDYREMADCALAIVNQVRCNKATVMSVGNILADNDIANLPYVLPHRGIKEFEDFYKDKPAVLVSTGPSLVKNVHLLKDIQDKVIIIAVAQALRPLLAYDITPDFITTVDFGEPNMGHLKGLMDSEVPLVCLNRTYAPLIKAYKGAKIVVSTPMQGFEKTAAGILTEKGTLDQGGSVAHMSLSLANHLGCDPIMVIGQDLSLGTTSHIPLADVAGEVIINENKEIIWKVKDQRSHLSGDKVCHSMGELRYVEGYFSDPVPTNIGLESFITAFETLTEIYNKDKKIFNCTEGGANIKGMIKRSLKQCILDHCHLTIDKNKIRPLLTEAENKDELIDKAIPLLNKDIENLKSIINKCSQGIYSSNRMKEIIVSKKNDSHKAKHLDHWSKKNFNESTDAFNLTILNPLVSVAIYNASVQIQSHKINVKLDKDKTLLEQKDILLTRISRNILILSAAKKAAKDLTKGYKKTLETLMAYKSSKDSSILNDTTIEKIDLSDANEYFKNGNYAHPYVDAIKLLKIDPDNELAIKVRDRAIGMREQKINEVIKKESEGMSTDQVLQYHELIAASRKSGLNKDYDNALWCLEEANRINPNQIDVLWGLGTTCHFLGRYPEAVGYYQQLLDKQPDNPKFQFEYGQVLLLVNNMTEGLKYIATAMTKTTEYNYFFKNIGDIYLTIKMDIEAIDAYEEYLKYFPLNKDVYTKLINCCMEINDDIKIAKYTSKLQELETNVRSKH